MTRTFKDQIGNSVDVKFPPSRIISLVPSQTELLFDLNLDEEVIGITRYCVLPTHWAKIKTIVGGTKDFGIEAIKSLKPGLILGNKEENTQANVEHLRKSIPVWISDINSLENAFGMIRSIGELTDRMAEAETIVRKIQISFEHMEPLVCVNHTVLYLIWRKPWMGVASDTFINDMLMRMGFRNCLESFERYPVLSENVISALKPDYIFLSSEPFPFAERHKSELLELCPTAKIVFVDGKMFSWYGSHLLKSANYFRSLRLY
jgi:ABC-type Fe3+-hydroxamate transport system substrate-binding protein